MKKTLIALAALAAGSAFAQSSVTMYGKLDVGYNIHATSATGNTQMGNFHAPSRFGIRGSEDLGGGLKANFNLESGNLGLDQGTNAVAFGREAWVGISGNFGETRLGLTSSLATKATVDFDLNEASASSAMDNAGISPVTWYGSSRRQNQLQYLSNSYSGFKGGVALDLAADATSLKPDGTNVLTTNKTSGSLMAAYANGPIAASFVVEGKRLQDGTTGYAAENRNATSLNGSYDFGVAKATLGLTQSPFKHVGYHTNGAAVGGKGVSAGVIAPFGATKVGAQYAHNSTSGDNALELFANYSLSKRTSLYADAVRLNYKHNGVAVDGNAAAPASDLTRFGVGVVHNF